MPEPNFPDAPLVHLSFDLRERTPLDPPSDHAQVAQCNFQHADGSLTSFDPEQLPKFLKALLTPTVVTQAETIAKQADLIASHEAELKAKDANLQDLLAEVDTLRSETSSSDTASAADSDLAPTPGFLGNGTPAT